MSRAGGASHARLFLLLAMVAAASCTIMAVQSPTPHGPVSARDASVWERSAPRAGPSYAIIPTQHIPLRFEHSRHVGLPNVTCVSCHRAATESDRAGDRLMPSESTCTPCHAIDRNDPLRVASPAARCDACHVGFDPAHPERIARVDFPPSNLIFSHRAHTTRGARCEDCHGTLREVGLATRLELPTMQSCFSCHRAGGTARATCVTCHLTEADGTLRTRFAEGVMNPPEWMPGLHHDADFWVNHRTVAADDGQRCAVCHRESECVECHDGRVRDRRNHPNDYVTLHATEARQNAESCTSCHRTATFCETCHMRVGVAEASPTSARALGRFHPPADLWSGRVVTSQHHAMESRRSLTVCVSCHTERDCTSCHAATGMGGGGISPHPPGWVGRCAMLLHAAPRGCAQCHEDLGALEGRCR